MSAINMPPLNYNLKAEVRPPEQRDLTDVDQESTVEQDSLVFAKIYVCLVSIMQQNPRAYFRTSRRLCNILTFISPDRVDA